MDAAVAAVAAVAEPAGPSRTRAQRTPALLLVLACAVAAAVLLPVVFLGIEATQTGWPQLSRVLFRSLTARLLTDTVELALCVTGLCAVLGTATAYATERTDLPLRRMWSTLIVVPLAIPDFIVGYTWSSIAPSLHGLTGAVLVMTLSLNPLVYLPVAAALRNTDPGLEEAARSLGLGPWAAFRKVTLRQIRPALLGGCLMVCLALLAEYGAFEIMRFQTFTTEIFTQLQIGFSTSTASALSVVLVLLALAVLAAQHYATGRARVARASGTRRPPVRHRLGPHAIWLTLGCAALAALSLGVPVVTLGYWLGQPDTTTLPAIASVPSATMTTVLYALLAATVTTVLAVPVALLVERHRSATAVLLERTTLIVQGLPGMVVAMSLVFFAERFAFRIYQSPSLMVAAYAVLYFPLALVSVRTSVAQAPARLEQMARSLGRRPLSVLLRVTLPLLAPGIAAGFCVVFLSVVTELTATLVLLPTGVRTLATQFWAFQNDQSYAAAAPYAAAMVALAVIPGYLLGMWFDKRGSDNRSAA